MSLPLPTDPPALLRWRGPLGQLIYALSRELDDSPPGAWARRELTRGATVSMCRIEGRRYILFSRPVLPRDDRGWAAWSNEVNIFLSWLSIQKWEPTEDLPPGATEGIVAPLWSAFVEPARE
jgi:hypothetical protein